MTKESKQDTLLVLAHYIIGSKKQFDEIFMLVESIPFKENRTIKDKNIMEEFFAMLGIMALIVAGLVIYSSVTSFINNGQISKLKYSILSLQKDVANLKAALEKDKKAHAPILTDEQKQVTQTRRVASAINDLAKKTKNESHETEIELCPETFTILHDNPPPVTQETKAPILQDKEFSEAQDREQPVLPKHNPSVSQEIQFPTPTSQKIKDLLLSLTGSSTEPDTKEQTKEETASVLQNNQPSFQISEQIKDSWMIWLGGICIGLAGIFLVKFSLDQGILTPMVRFILSLVIGISLHLLAEYLRRKKGGHPALAALCGGASITLFAAFLAAHHLFALLPTMVIFIGLTIVSLATMFLAIIHGPVLAILGLLSAYTLPILVNSGSNNIVGLLTYISIITASGFILNRYVTRTWLWTSIVGLSCLWAGAVIGNSHLPDFVFTLYLLVLGYMIVAIAHGDWLLQSETIARCTTKHPLKRLYQFTWDEGDKVFLALIAILVLQTLQFIVVPFSASLLYTMGILPVFVLIVARRKSDFASLAWLSLIANVAVILSHFLYLGGQGQFYQLLIQEQNILLVLLLGLFCIYVGFSTFNAINAKDKGIWVALAAITPVILLAITYLLVTNLRGDAILLALCLITGIVLFLLAHKLPLATKDKSVLIALLIPAHLAYALFVVFIFEEATLTLALSTMLVSLAFMREHYKAPELDWFIKLVGAVVVTRLTLNPFLLTYSPEIHWSLWTYGGSALCAAIACHLLPKDEKVRCWMEGMTIHLAMIFIASEMRYQLYDGQIFIKEYTSFEAAINTLLWSSSAFLYWKRSHHSESFMKNFYSEISNILFSFATLNHIIFTIFKYNPLFASQGSSTNLFLAYGLPIIPLVLAIIFKVTKKRNALFAATGFSIFYFISLGVRSFFTPKMHITFGSTNAEIYTYSVVWLFMSVATLVLGAKKRDHTCYKTGITCILIVVAKIFLVDMGELEGLYRVASFMGLGLTLLGIAFLHKQLNISELDK